MLEIKIKNLEETREFAKKLSKYLKAGTVVGLMGDLGTGKTALTKMIAEELEIKEIITSPTYTIIQEYNSGIMPLYHFDVYRINSSEDMFEIGYEDYFYGKGITIVEWADLVEDLLPKDAIVIKITYGETEEGRLYNITGLEKI